MSEGRYGRTRNLSIAVRLIVWLSTRTRIDHISEVEQALETGRRSAYRALQAAESCGLVQKADAA